MIDVARIDQWAARGKSPFHKASTGSKAGLLLLVVAAAVLSRTPYPLLTGYCLLLAVAAVTGLPWFRIAILSWYAAIFALLYGFSIGEKSILLLFVVKAITPAFAMLIFIITTPYPRIFALMSTVLPEALAAALFMTYRSLFILFDMMDSFATAIRLRGGFSPGSLIKNSRNISRGIGMLLIRAVEHASRLYAVMMVRGYNGSMVEKSEVRLQNQDWLPVATGISVLVFVLLWN